MTTRRNTPYLLAKPDVFVLAITTVNREPVLARLLETWENTRCRAVHWLLLVADDGSTDGTLAMLAEFRPEGVDKVVLHDPRRGVHHQKNQQKKYLENYPFDFCFMVDDDVAFLQAGWDMEYYAAARRTGYDHLCLFSPEVDKPRRDETYEGLACLTNQDYVHGCFFTLTQRVIQQVGYCDLQNFGLTGHGHTDYTWRCARAGFNREGTPLDIPNSSRYISVLQKFAQQAIPLVLRQQEGVAELKAHKLRVMSTPGRLYVPYNELDRRVGDPWVPQLGQIQTQG